MEDVVIREDVEIDGKRVRASYTFSTDEKPYADASWVERMVGNWPYIGMAILAPKDPGMLKYRAEGAMRETLVARLQELEPIVAKIRAGAGR